MAEEKELRKELIRRVDALLLKIRETLRRLKEEKR